MLNTLSNLFRTTSSAPIEGMRYAAALAARSAAIEALEAAERDMEASEPDYVRAARTDVDRCAIAGKLAAACCEIDLPDINAMRAVNRYRQGRMVEWDRALDNFKAALKRAEQEAVR